MSQAATLRKNHFAAVRYGMILSENVPVIRSDDGTLLDKPVICSFITCPAVNRRLVRPFLSDEKINLIMEKRINAIVSLASSSQADLVILGAFGCGVFGNKREVVIPLFEKAINKYGGECEYVFAIPD